MRKKIENIFDFDEKKELTIYTYLCGEKVSKKNLKKLKDTERCTTYKGWSANIYDKYKVYNTDSLTEFSKYLNYKIRDKSNSLNITESILFPAMISCYFSLLFTQVSEVSFKGEIIIVIILFLIFIFLLIFSVMKVIKSVADDITSRKMKVSMYEDYKKEIEKLIESKKNSHQE